MIRVTPRVTHRPLSSSTPIPEPRQTAHVVRSADVARGRVAKLDEDIDDVGLLHAANAWEQDVQLVVRHYRREHEIDGRCAGRVGDRRWGVVVAERPRITRHVADRGEAPRITRGHVDVACVVADERAQRVRRGEHRVRVVPVPLLEDAIDVGVVRPEDRVEGRVRIVRHVRADPSVEVVMRLLEEAVEIRPMRIVTVRRRWVEAEDVRPRVARRTLGRAEHAPALSERHLRLEVLDQTQLGDPLSRWSSPEE